METGLYTPRATVWLSALCVLACAQPAVAAPFVDDAQRSVPLPSHIDRVFAAGAPAEVLLYTLAPEKLVGRNHLPDAAALEYMPPELRHPTPITRLPKANDASQDAELLQLKPDVYIDYGDINADYVTSLNNVQQRTGIPAIILDGGIEHIPSVYRRLGAGLHIKQRGELLAREAERILHKYRGSSQHLSLVPRVYLACSADARIACLEDERNGEVVKLLGAVNVAGSTSNAPMRQLEIEEIKAMKPDVIIAASSESASKIRNDPAWQIVKAVGEQHVYVPPRWPFSWGPRPPSVNRLLGLIWLAYVLPTKPIDATLQTEVRRFFKTFYQVELNDDQLQRLLTQE